MLIGVQVAIDLGVSSVVIETDALLEKQAIDSNQWCLSPAGKLIKEIQELAQLNFSSFETSVVPRTCNYVAHALAMLGRVCRDDENPLVDPLTDCILNLVAADCAVSK